MQGLDQDELVNILASIAFNCGNASIIFLYLAIILALVWHGFAKFASRAMNEDIDLSSGSSVSGGSYFRSITVRSVNHILRCEKRHHILSWSYYLTVRDSDTIRYYRSDDLLTPASPPPVSQIGSTALLLRYRNIVILKWTTERKPDSKLVLSGRLVPRLHPRNYLIALQSWCTCTHKTTNGCRETKAAGQAMCFCHHICSK